MSLVWTPTIKKSNGEDAGAFGVVYRCQENLAPEEGPKVPDRSDCDDALRHAGKHSARTVWRGNNPGGDGGENLFAWKQGSSHCEQEYKQNAGNCIWN